MLALASVLALIAGVSATACFVDSDCGNYTYNKCCADVDRYTNGSSVGRCRDSRYEQCCDRTVCNSYYESCCNSTCCAESQACVSRSTLDGPLKQCSATEKFDMRRGLITIGFPLMFGIAAIVSAVVALGVVLMSGFKASAVAVTIILVAIIVVIFSILMIVSPLVFPMFFVSSVASLTILSLGATQPSQRPELVLGGTLLLIASAFVIMINPFSTNSLLGGGPSYGSVDIDHSPGGVLGVVLSYLSEYDQIVATGHITSLNGGISGGANRPIFSSCSAFYLGYFRNDPTLYTDWRVHNQGLTAIPWGLCSRGYLTYQLFDAVLVTVLLPVLAILVVVRWWQVRSTAAPEVTA